jgi:tetraprenyl-beta-curcumene synthase
MPGAETMPGAARGHRGELAGSIRALAFANARYWPSVAPVVRRELTGWEAPAAGIADPALRALAVGKLREEHFNAEVAATLATLAPMAPRATAARAIVALELLFDYLDGRTELACAEPTRAEPIAEAERLFAAFIGALERAEPTGAEVEIAGATEPEDADGAYLLALSQVTRESLFALPAASAVADVARAAAARCAQAQTRLHAASTLGEEQLREWASAHGRASGLEWREYAGGCASSVLAVHALIAAAADPLTSGADALALDGAYLAIGGVITMLDSLVDHSADVARGEPGFIRLFQTREELGQSLRALTREALARARRAPHGEHHAMTLAGAVAYYTTHPGAREAHAREVVAAVRGELSPTIRPTLAVMRGWRLAKQARALARRATNTQRETRARPTRGRSDLQ